MPSFSQIKILPYPAEELAMLVLDIKEYPEFLPWCEAARIITTLDKKIIAELTIQVKGFVETYQSEVTYQKLDPHKHLIKVKAISGPFKFLENSWEFEEKQELTYVSFNINFQMKSIFLDKLLGVFFSKATEKMMEAFEKRAILLHGR